MRWLIVTLLLAVSLMTSGCTGSGPTGRGSSDEHGSPTTTSTTPSTIPPAEPHTAGSGSGGSGSGGSASAGASEVSRFGIFFIGAKRLQVARAVGAHYVRAGMPVNPPGSQAAATITAVEHAGFGAVVGFRNASEADNGSTTGRAKSGPVTDKPAFQQALGRDLDTTHPALVTIENEENGTNFSTATAPQYLQELTDAVQVAHAKGYKITNGGITGPGLALACWHHLWITGHHAAADAFAQKAFTEGRNRIKTVLGDIPDSSHPTRALLANDATDRLRLQASETLIAGYRSTGIDYINFHWYQVDPATMGQAVTYLEHVTGLQAVTNEMGQFDTNASTMTGLLSETIALRMPYVIWFASDGQVGPAVGLADNDGTLRATGRLFKNFVAAHH